MFNLHDMIHLCSKGFHFQPTCLHFRLKWKEDLSVLMPFNRKLLWVQGGFTVLTILAFGTLTLALHAELLSGDRAALALALFIGAYWTSRILVDAFYFSHEDWPKGMQFVIGHALLTLLFFSVGCELSGIVRLAYVAQGKVGCLLGSRFSTTNNSAVPCALASNYSLRP